MNPLIDWESFDVETVGDEPGYALQPWRAPYHQASIRTYSISWLEKGKLKNMAREADTASIRLELHNWLTLAKNQGKYILAWKATFDVAWLVAYGLVQEVRDCKWIDPMILWKNLDRNRRTYGLKDAVAEFYPQHAGYGEGIDFEGDLETLLKYNAMDSDFTLLLALKFWGLLTPRERQAVMIDMEDIVAVAERNVQGIMIDVVEVNNTAKILSKLRQENYNKLLPHLETFEQFFARGGKLSNPDWKKRFPKIYKEPDRESLVGWHSEVNLDSDKQLANLLFCVWGLPPYKKTKGGAFSVDKESLLELSHIDERAKHIQQYRETTGKISKCVKSVVESLQYNNPYPGYRCDPIVRPTQNKAGTYTDRCTYSSKTRAN